MANSLLTFSIHSNLAQTIQQEIFTRIAKYYFVLGRCYPWENELAADTALDTYAYELKTRKDFVRYYEISPSDVCIVIDRYQWQSGYVYDSYDEYTPTYTAVSGATSLSNAQFYTVTNDFNVYKCLYNGGNNSSVIKPYGQLVAPITTSDGYVWKFMYTIPLYLRNKFLTAKYIPVTNVLSSQFYSDGKLTNVILDEKGAGYSLNVIKTGNVKSHGTNLKKIIGSGTVFLTELVAGKKIRIADEIFTVASIQSNAELTLEEFAYFQSYVQYTLINTMIEIVGDGARPNNNVKPDSVSVTSVGSRYGVGTTVIFSAPEYTGAGSRTATGTATIVADEITAITLTDSGYGYKLAPTITFGNTAGGSSALAVCNAIKTSAFLDPVIDSITGEITMINLVNVGEGYTTTVATFRSLDSHATTVARITINLSNSDLTSNQVQQETLAINGPIYNIRVVTGGTGYVQASTTVSITGSGKDCTATAVVGSSGSVDKILVSNAGTLYTDAIVTIHGVGTGATAVAVIAPIGGHGKNAITELFGRTVSFYGKLTTETIKDLPFSSYYRQISLVKRPKMYNSALSYNTFIGDSCYKITTSGIANLNSYVVNAVVYVYNGSVKNAYRVVNKSGLTLVLTAIDNSSPPIVGSSIKVLDANLNILASCNALSVTYPDVNNYSGDIVYIDNRLAFKPSGDETIILASRFRI